MSIDFGGSLLLKVENEKLNILKNKNIDIYYNDNCWSDNKCSVSDGYRRVSFLIATPNKYIDFIIDNRIYSGFVSAGKIKIVDRKTNSFTNCKLVESNSYNGDNQSFTKLGDSDFQIIDGYSFECYGDEEDEIFMPQIYINNDPKENSLSIGILIKRGGNKNDEILFLNFDENCDFINVTLFDTNSKTYTVYDCVEPSKQEYLDSLLYVNEVFIKDEKVDKFSNTITIKTIKGNSGEQSEKLDDDERRKITNLLDNLATPNVPNLDIVTYKDNKLIFDGPYNVISEYLVKYALLGLTIRECEDLNNFYYDDEEIEKLNIDLIIPKNITQIERQAFASEHFNSISFETNENAIEPLVIGSRAFANTRIKELKLPESLVVIEDGAFAENQLTEINIPKNVLKIGSGVFGGYYCNISKINIDPENEFYTSLNSNVILKKRTNTLIFSNKLCEIPIGTMVIGKNVFNTSSVKEPLIIPEGVTTIKERAFSQSDFKSIEFPKTLKFIADYAFSYCRAEKIIIKSLINLGEFAFNDCRNLNEIKIINSPEISDETIEYYTNSFIPNYFWNEKDACIFKFEKDSNGDFVGKRGLPDDKKSITLAVRKNCEYFKFASPELKNDKEFVLALVEINGEILKYVSDELKNDKEVVLAAVSNNPWAIQYACESLKNDEEINRIIEESNNLEDDIFPFK